MNDETEQTLEWLESAFGCIQPFADKAIRVITDLQAIADRWEPGRDLGYIYPTTREQIAAHVAAGGKAEHRGAIGAGDWRHTGYPSNFPLRNLRLVPIPPAPAWREVVVTKENVWKLRDERLHDSGWRIENVTTAASYAIFFTTEGSKVVNYGDIIRLANEGEA